MRLRTRIQAPERFEDEDYDTPAANDATKPAFPRLLKQQTASFNPHLPPAVFPSVKQAHPQEDGHRMLKDFAADMMDIDRHFDQTFLPMVHHREHINTQTALATSSNEAQDPLVLGRSFLDDAETSDEEEHEVSLCHSTIPMKREILSSESSSRFSRLVPIEPYQIVLREFVGPSLRLLFKLRFSRTFATAAMATRPMVSLA